MKNQFHTLLVLSFAFSANSNGALVKDINQSVTKLMGEAPSVTNVIKAQTMGLDRGGPNDAPWSGSFWPDIIGGIANHYRDHSKFGSQINFVLRSGVAKNRTEKRFERVATDLFKMTEEEINTKLSPAEKYDLLLGDTDFNFTRAVLEDNEFRRLHLKRSIMKNGTVSDDSEQYEGVNNNEHYSDVSETYARFEDEVKYRYWIPRKDSLSYWFGICDGWSTASIHLPRPKNAVTVTGALGHKITFYPDDLKALGSYLFARTNNDYMSTMNYQFAGKPCAEYKEPDTDEKGYVRDIRCNDLDPGLFHLALLNRMGVQRMGFVFEIDNNKKINNHPAIGYSLKYFNPMTGEEGALKKSIAPRYLVKDAYDKRRHQNATSLVGVIVKLDYQNYQWVEKNRDKTSDSAADDLVKSVEYVYDLELDADGNILGGEWGNRSKEKRGRVKYADQPDFIWMGARTNLAFSENSLYSIPGFKADPNSSSVFGNMIWAWDGKGQLPPDWVTAAAADRYYEAPLVGEMIKVDGKDEVFPIEARDSVMKSAQPLSHIVYYLFDRAAGTFNRQNKR